MARGRHLEDTQPARLEVGPDESGDLARIGDVGLVERDQAGTVLEPAVRLELGLDDVEIRQRVAARVDRGAVDDVDQRGAALDVAQEVVAQAAAFAGALDQSGHVGNR